MSVSSNIKYLREKNGLTQEQLADKLNVARSTVTQWERGWSNPRMGMVQKLAGVFGVSTSDIVSESPSLPNAIPISEPQKAYLPLLGRVHAGNAQEPDIIDSHIPVPYEVWEHHKDGYLLEVEGSCMNKVYPEGCHVLIDPKKAPINGSIAVVKMNEDNYVMRRMYRGANTLVLSPESFDESYEDIVITNHDDVSVELVGTVVWYQPKQEME